MATGGEIEVHRNGGLASFEGAAPAIKNAMSTLAAVSEFVAKQLVEDVDYGRFEGIKKDCLLQPGAAKIAMLFNCRDSYDIRTTEMGNGHVEHVVITKLILRNGSDIVLAEGVGSCSTMEGRYRYRNSEPESTGKPVPKTYWDKRNADDAEGAQQLIGGRGFQVKKIDGQWMICKAGDGKVENPNIHDVRNTVLKMAKKRSKVDAALNLGCVADLFTQDVDEQDLPRKSSPAPADNRPTSAKVNERRQDDDRQRDAKKKLNEDFKPAPASAPERDAPWTVEQFNEWLEKAASGGNAWWKKKAGDDWATMTKGQQAPFNTFRLVGHLCKWFGGGDGYTGQVKGFEGLIKEDMAQKCAVLASQFPQWKRPFETELKQYMQHDIPDEIRAEVAKKKAKEAAQNAPDPVADMAGQTIGDIVDGPDDDAWGPDRE